MAKKAVAGNVTLDSLDEAKRAEIDALIDSQYRPETSHEGSSDAVSGDGDASAGDSEVALGDGNAEANAPVPWRERDGGQYPYLVRGAYLHCQYGSHIRRLNLPRSHGFYIKDYPMMNAMDNEPGEGFGNISPFGVCQAPAGPKGVGTVLLKSEKTNPITGEPYPGKIEDNVKGPPCTALIVGPWQNAHPDTVVGLADESPYAAVTVGSFLVCTYCGIIEPLTSGQPEMDRTDMLQNGFEPLSDEELLSIDPEDLPFEQREEYFNELYMRLADPSHNLTEEQRSGYNNALGKMILAERMGFVFDESGQYGGNQANPAQRFRTDLDFQDYMRNLLPGMTDDEIRIYLNGFTDPIDESNNLLGYRNVGCGYMATANLVLVEYANKPDEFERIFGFPMYTCETDGSIHPNFDKLAISIYHNIGNDGRNGSSPSGIFPKNAIENYLTAHGVNVDVSRIDSFPCINEIKNDLKNGPVPISLNPCIMYDAVTGDKIEVGAHAITITELTDDGDLIVSSWGAQYIVKQSDYDSINTGDGEYVAYDATTFE